ncbi:hypothetical protein D3C83_229350 [compost metagenome]
MRLARRPRPRNQHQPDLFAWADHCERLALPWPARRLVVRYGLSAAAARCIAGELYGGAP